MNWYRSITALLAAVMLVGCAATQETEVQTMPTANPPMGRGIELTDSGGLSYLLHLPAGYDAAADTTWPVILFLHGAGERGTDLELVKVHGIPKLAEADPKFPFIAVAPQSPAETRWPAHLDALDTLLDHILADHAADPNRVYLTGLSLGGQGTWEWALAKPERFAAIAPICGWGQPELACNLKDMPVWAFHGALDTVVPPAGSEDMVAAIEACGGDPRLTIYPDAGHDSWTVTYDNPELYAWLLEQVK